MANPDEIESAIESALLHRSHSASGMYCDPVNARNYTCSVNECGRKAYARGFCNAHYLRDRNGLSLSNPVRARKRGDMCSECGVKCNGKGGWGLCAKHYNRLRRETIKSAIVSVLGGVCQMCLKQYPLCVYDFHHMSGKTDSPSSMIANSSAYEIAMEISKCVLLCANCHRIEHNAV